MKKKSQKSDKVVLTIVNHFSGKDLFHRSWFCNELPFRGSRRYLIFLAIRHYGNLERRQARLLYLSARSCYRDSYFPSAPVTEIIQKKKKSISTSIQLQIF